MEKDLSSKMPVSKLVVLFPVTYGMHIAEEYWSGERFYNWISRIAGTRMTENYFLLLNSIFMLIVVIATSIAIWRRDHRIPLVLASIVSINALLHVFGSVFTYSYSPGVITAVLLWLPLAVCTFNQEHEKTSAVQKIMALAIGVTAHAIVSCLVLYNG